MSLDQRPYIGTWKLNGQQLVQMTPDALVYINGDTSVPGCSKCSGKINIQQFLTEVSVDAGTEAGSASATFTLSIPLHHTDSFARDAKFILRPGLEVHVYMRGYFPVKGLYKNLAEAQSQNTVTPGTRVRGLGVSEGSATDSPIPATTGKLSKKEWSAAFGPVFAQVAIEKFPDNESVQANFVAVALSHSYLESGGHPRPSDFNLFGSHTKPPPEYAGGDGSYEAQAASDKKVYKWSQFNSYASAAGYYAHQYRSPLAQQMLLAGPASGITYQIAARSYGSGKISKSVSNDMKAWGFPSGKNEFTDLINGEFSTNPKAKNAITQRAQIVLASLGYGPGTPQYEQIVAKGAMAFAYGENIHDRPRADFTKKVLSEFKSEFPGIFKPPVVAEKALALIKQLDEQSTPAEIPSRIASLPEPLDSANPPQGNFGPSLLEEMGLSGMGVEDTLAYPYYHVFHGVVTEAGHSYSGGINTINVTCSSMLHFWQYHNMSTNASVFGARPLNSKNKMSMVGNNFTGMHPYAIMYALHYDMAGAAGGVGWALSGKSNQTAVAQSGESLFSLNVRYWEERFSRGTKLRMHGATGELFSTMAATWLSRNSSSTLTQALRSRYNATKASDLNVLTESALVGLTSGKGLRDAIKATQFQAQNKPGNEQNKPGLEINILDMQAFVSNIGDWGNINLFESTYESKLDIANKVCQITGFEFFQDVDGDFVFKPPMWNLDTSGSRVYRIEDIDLISINFSEKEPQVTYMTVKGSQFKNLLGTGLENEWGVRGQYIDYRLVAQFGWRPGSYETNYFNDPKAMFFAAVNRMDVMNIGMSTASVTIPVRPELRPGYPVYIPYLDCFYYCNSFAHSHSVGGQCTTALQLVGKRAKFYAPGETTSGVSGIAAIKLGDTKLPERPLGVLDREGKPRLSGFPNVVMALDPTAINPLFFVVGSDIENIGDARVVKYLLKTAVELKVLREEDPKQIGGKKFYTMTKTIPGQGGEEGTSQEVRFFFDEMDLNEPTSGTDINILAEAADYANLQRKLVDEGQKKQEKLDEAKHLVLNIYAELDELRNDPRGHKENAAGEKIRKDIIALDIKARNAAEAETKLGADLTAQHAVSEASQTSGAGIGALIEIIRETSARYRNTADFQGRGDLSSTINLLDMLSDKKAIFTNGQQPGQYRYYSASHPKEAEQGPRTSEYTDKRVVDGPPAQIGDREIPEIDIYAEYPSSPFPGARSPEAQLVRGRPTAGIRVLTGNGTPRGEVLPTSEITEVMFSVQDVSVVKRVTSKYIRASVSGMGAAADRKVAGFFTVDAAAATPSGTSTLLGLFGGQWTALNLSAEIANHAMLDTAASGSPSVALLNLTLPAFPDAVGVGTGAISTGNALSAYKYAGNEAATTDLGTTASKSPLTGLVNQAGAGLAALYTKKLLGMVNVAVKQIKKAEDRERVASAFRTAFMVGAPVKTTTVGHSTKKKTDKLTTFSPVFPVSDAQGYHVIGSYRYGRGVSIEPDGVFDQMHKHDLFSLLDRNLVDQILRVFVQRKTIKIPAMTTETLPDGTKKVVPVASTEIGGAQAAEYLNEEALRQLRAANLTDKQILDYSTALSKGTNPNQLDFNLANLFASDLDGVLKVPVINAAYSLADLNFQQAGHVCDCKAAEANVLLSAFGQEDFLPLAQSGTPAHQGLGSDPSDTITRWVATQAELAASTWEQQQQAFRGQVLDRGGTHIVQRFQEAFGIDSGGITRPGPIDKALAAAAQAQGKLKQAIDLSGNQIDNLSRNSTEDL